MELNIQFPLLIQVIFIWLFTINSVSSSNGFYYKKYTDFASHQESKGMILCASVCSANPACQGFYHRDTSKAPVNKDGSNPFKNFKNAEKNPNCALLIDKKSKTGQQAFNSLQDKPAGLYVKFVRRDPTTPAPTTTKRTTTKKPTKKPTTKKPTTKKPSTPKKTQKPTTKKPTTKRTTKKPTTKRTTTKKPTTKKPTKKPTTKRTTTKRPTTLKKTTTKRTTTKRPTTLKKTTTKRTTTKRPTTLKKTTTKRTTTKRPTTLKKTTTKRTTTKRPTTLKKTTTKRTTTKKPTTPKKTTTKKHTTPKKTTTKKHTTPKKTKTTTTTIPPTTTTTIPPTTTEITTTTIPTTVKTTTITTVATTPSGPCGAFPDPPASWTWHGTPKNYDDAKKTCAATNEVVVAAKTEEQFCQVYKMMKKHGAKTSWIGLVLRTPLELGWTTGGAVSLSELKNTFKYDLRNAPLKVPPISYSCTIMVMSPTHHYTNDNCKSPSAHPFICQPLSTATTSGVPATTLPAVVTTTLPAVVTTTLPAVVTTTLPAVVTTTLPPQVTTAAMPTTVDPCAATSPAPSTWQWNAAQTYPNAQKTCLKENKVVVPAKTREEFCQVYQMMQQKGAQTSWIGLSGKNVTEFGWSDGGVDNPINLSQFGYKVNQGPPVPRCTAMMAKPGEPRHYTNVYCKENKFPFICSPGPCTGVAAPPSDWVWHSELKTYADAKDVCNGDDKIVVPAKTQDEFCQVQTLTAKHDADNSWIGLRYDGSAWSWTDGGVINPVDMVAQFRYDARNATQTTSSLVLLLVPHYQSESRKENTYPFICSKKPPAPAPPPTPAPPVAVG